jgi:hypothetical protein
MLVQMKPEISRFDSLSSRSLWQATHPGAYVLVGGGRAQTGYILLDIRVDGCPQAVEGDLFQPGSRERDDHAPVEASKMSFLRHCGAI